MLVQTESCDLGPPPTIFRSCVPYTEGRSSLANPHFAHYLEFLIDICEGVYCLHPQEKEEGGIYSRGGEEIREN